MALVTSDGEELASCQGRLGIDPVDWAWLLANRPSPRDLAPLRGELLAGMGVPAPQLTWSRARDPYLHPWVYLSALPDVRRFHRERGVPEEVSWASLADLGRQLSLHRRVTGLPGVSPPAWLSLHFRGLLYQLGRLQFQRTAVATVDVHVPATGPLRPQECDASFAWAREFFGRHFPRDACQAFTCTSWLLDDQLAEYLPETSNIIAFQRRFTPVVESVTVGDADVLAFVFDLPHGAIADLASLPQRTTLERAIVAHWRAGRSWRIVSGRCELHPTV